MKLVVGLGNPGKKYELTRHNIGFLVVDWLADKMDQTTTNKRFSSLVGEVSVEGEKWLLVKPQTYMNRSGLTVVSFVNYYRIDYTQDLLVICDDLDLPFGRIRLRGKGSAGGHRGLESIINHIGSPDFPRLRIGIGAADNAVDYVLGRFSQQEQQGLEEIIATSADAASAFFREGLAVAMNRYNNWQKPSS